MENAKDKIATRGVLLDIPRYKGKQWLEPGEAIYSEDLDGAAGDGQGQRGDGRYCPDSDRSDRPGPGPRRAGVNTVAVQPQGLGVDCAAWICEKEIAGYATDTWGTEVIPNETAEIFQPLHMILIVHARYAGG